MTTKYTQITTSCGKRLFAIFTNQDQLHVTSEACFEVRNSPDDRGDVFEFGGTEYKSLRTWFKVSEGEDFPTISVTHSLEMRRIVQWDKDPAKTHKAKAQKLVVEAVTAWIDSNPQAFIDIWLKFTRRDSELSVSAARRTLQDLKAATASLERGVQALESAESLAERREALAHCGSFLKYGVTVTVSSEYGEV